MKRIWRAFWSGFWAAWQSATPVKYRETNVLCVNTIVCDAEQVDEVVNQTIDDMRSRLHGGSHVH